MRFPIIIRHFQAAVSARKANECRYLEPKLRLAGWLAMTLILFLLNGLLVTATAANALQSVRVGEKPSKTRVVFDLGQAPDYQIQTLSSPNRLVVDFKDTRNAVSFKKKYLSDPRLFSIQVKNTSSQTRIVLGLHKSLKYKYFTLGASAGKKHRLVIDLLNEPAVARSKSSQQPSRKTTGQSIKRSAAKLSAPERRQIKSATSTASTVKNYLVESGLNLAPGQDEIVVAIDAGHGGKDPGAIGKHGLYEKAVTLKIAKQMQKLVNRQPNMRAVMIRDRDVFVSLKDRISIAKRHKADIFVSIHADAFVDKRVRGGTVYIVSQKGASSAMASLLAKKENSALYDVSLKGMDQDVAFALSDMSREANLRASRKLAQTVLNSMSRRVLMHKKSVQSANFAVLRHIDMPALLIETAFISNPFEERKLRNPEFHKRVALSIVKGVNQFAARRSNLPNWGESLYVRHKVKSGDTLSEIADTYGVRLSTLKKVNGIRNANQLFVGKLLKVPITSKQLAKL